MVLNYVCNGSFFVILQLSVFCSCNFLYFRSATFYIFILQQTDSLNSAVVILDNDNVIKYQNMLWGEFIDKAGIEIDHSAMGVNYKDICSHFKSGEGKSVCDGIKEVISKEIDSFVSDYQIKNTNIWCRIKVTPFVG